MLKFSDRPRGTNELVLYWTALSTRCVLVGNGSGVDLQLMRGEVVVRRTLNVDPRFAREIARVWRVEFEFARAAPDPEAAGVCPECGDGGPSLYRGLDGEQRQYCRTCGNDWAGPPA